MAVLEYAPCTVPASFADLSLWAETRHARPRFRAGNLSITECIARSWRCPWHWR